MEFQSVSITFALSLDIPEKNLAFFIPSVIYTYWSSPSPLFSRLKSSRLSLSQPVLSSQPVNPYSSLWPFTALTPVCPCLSCTLSRTGQSTTNVAFPGPKKRITSLHLLVMLFLIQHSPLVTLISERHICWLMFNLLPIEPSGHPLQSCFPDTKSTAFTGAWGHSPAGAGLGISLHWT